MPTGTIRTAAGALLLAAASGACSGPRATERQAAQGAELESLLSVRDGRSGERLSLEALLDAAAEADVVFLGESHTDETTHRVELAVYEGLLARRDGRVVLALEMFERDAQPALDEYLAGRLDEAAFLEQSRPWGNYATAYRPLIEAARSAGAPVVASNFPRPLRQALAADGGDPFATLTADQRPLAPAELRPNTPLYWRRADNAIRGHSRADGRPHRSEAAFTVLTPEQDAASPERLTSTQSLWDNAMGESCALALDRHPGHAVCHVNGGFHSQYWDGTVRQLALRRPDARVATIAIVPVASPGSAELAGLPEADYVVFAERRADDPRDRAGSIWVQRDLEFRLHLPPSVADGADGAPVPLLIWLPDDGLTAEESLELWTLRLGDEAAIAVLEPASVETQEDLAPGGRWFGADSFDEDVGVAATAVERLWSYLVDRTQVDRGRVCLAGEGTGATMVAAAALYADELAARAVAIAPRGFAKLRDLALPLPELRGDDPRPATSLRVVVSDAPGPGGTSPAAVVARRAGRVRPRGVSGRALADDRAAAAAATASRQRGARRAGAHSGAAARRHGGGLVHPRRQRLAPRAALGAPGRRALRHVPVVDTPPDDPALTPLVLETRAEEFAAESRLPVCPGPFGGTTLVVLPAGTDTPRSPPGKALVENDPLTKQNRFTRLRVAVDGGDPAQALPAVLATLESENRRNVLIAPAVFYADGETMRALRRQTHDFEERMTLHWRPGLGGR
jgi:uncharacterized iron-regulated protein